ncbi:hypothetical protein DFJ43DRAFT_376329 [Lentinula guzmanii]|uniref:N-acetyltransferase domain-containing protein n=1 Tax=Lentinula guzmanii TaxID=2804957 RepID=A0AA38MZB0_9AGAR|nr:hypothetical protein DFJ43DRAFT_376329 [Lentinula guzmanii]
MEYSYSVVPIPTSPLLQAHVDKYASLRLLALRTNPECFFSTQDEEGRFSREQWRGRIDTDDRVTLIAVASRLLADSSPESSSSSSFANTSVSLDSLDGEAAEWVGLITVLTPEFLKERRDNIPPKFQKYAMCFGEPANVLVSMWVHPEHRRKGLGGRLISEAIDWVKKRTVTTKNFDVSNGRLGGAVVLEVVKGNTGAGMLYRAMGFETIDSEDASIWMGKRLDNLPYL